MRGWAAAAALTAAMLWGCAPDPETRTVHFPRAADAPPCDRPAPRPALEPPGPLVLAEQFTSLGGGRAVEEARLRGAVRLEVRDNACGGDAQSFRFYLPRAQVPPAGPSDAYALAARLLRGVAPPREEGDGLRLLADALAKAAAAPAPPALGAPVPMGAYQELRVSVAPPDEGGAYSCVLAVGYRLKL